MGTFIYKWGRMLESEAGTVAGASVPSQILYLVLVSCRPQLRTSWAMVGETWILRHCKMS